MIIFFSLIALFCEAADYYPLTMPNGCYKGQTMSYLRGHGPLCVEDCAIKMKARVSWGSLDSRKSTFRDLFVNGSVWMDECTVEKSFVAKGDLRIFRSRVLGPVEVGGAFDASCTAFLGPILSTAGHIVFSDVQAQSICVQNTTGLSVHSVVRCIGDTVIHGDIVFENGSGKVIVEEGVSVLGRVVGGSVVYSNQKHG